MNTQLARIILGISFGIFFFSGIGLAAEPAEVGKFVKARIEISEMMMNYFSGGQQYGKDGQRPSPDSMRKMGEDINAKLSTLLATHDLTIDEYRQRSPEVFASEAALKSYLSKHSDLKDRYQALPLDRMGHSQSGRGY